MQDLNQQHFKDALKSQYHASLDMLGETIEKCPVELWTSQEYRNAFWQVAYHTLYFTHLYLSPGNDEFIPWIKHKKDNQNPDCFPGDPDPKSDLPWMPDPYTKEELLEYVEFCKSIVDEFVDNTDLSRQDCGFPWYKVSKFEHQLVNLRHLQHGAAQLADRLRQKENVGINWVGRRRK